MLRQLKCFLPPNIFFMFLKIYVKLILMHQAENVQGHKIINILSIGEHKHLRNKNKLDFQALFEHHFPLNLLRLRLCLTFMLFFCKWVQCPDECELSSADSAVTLFGARAELSLPAVNGTFTLILHFSWF